MDIQCGVFARRHICLCTRADKAAGEISSPDGKWEFRAGAAGEQDDFVIAKAGSVEASLVLSEEESLTDLQKRWVEGRSYANIVWAPDSKRFAYNLHSRQGLSNSAILSTRWEHVAQARCARIQRRHDCTA